MSEIEKWLFFHGLIGYTVSMKKSSNTFARNKRAYHDFEIMDEFEAGIELK